SVDDGKDVAFTENQDLLVVDGDFRAAVLPVQDLVADLDLHLHALALFDSAGADRDDFALLRLLLGGVGNVEATAHLLGLLQWPHDDTVGQGRDFRGGSGSGFRCHVECSSCYECGKELRNGRLTCWHSAHASANNLESYPWGACQSRE